MPLPTFDKLAAPKKEKLVAAAVGEFSRLPYDRVSIFEVARRAGISRSSFYYYFADKEDLYQYLIGLLREELLRALPASVRPDEAPALLLDFFADQREREWGSFVARMLERAQSWPRGGPETIGPSDGWLRKRFSDSGGFDRLDRRDQKLVGFIVRECLCYQLGAYYRREITREQLHQEAQRMMELLRYGVAGRHAAGVAL